MDVDIVQKLLVVGYKSLFYRFYFLCEVLVDNVCQVLVSLGNLERVGIVVIDNGRKR